MTKTKIYGHWVVYDTDDNEVHRIASHHPKGSSHWNRAEDGLYFKVDFERFYVEWKDAT